MAKTRKRKPSRGLLPGFVDSHGHVVIAPDHTGNTVLDQVTGSEDPGEAIVFNRPSDVGRLIDAFTGAADDPAAAPWVAVVDAGPRYDPLAAGMAREGVPVFRTIDHALAVLARWYEVRRR